MSRPAWLALLLALVVCAGLHPGVARLEDRDDRALALAEQAARAGADFARAALAWDPDWGGAPLVQLLSDGPYRLAFSVRRSRSSGLVRLVSTGFVSDSLRPRWRGMEVRGIGKGLQGSFQPFCVVAAAVVAGQVRVGASRSGDSLALPWEEPPGLRRISQRAEALDMARRLPPGRAGGPAAPESSSGRSLP